MHQNTYKTCSVANLVGCEPRQWHRRRLFIANALGDANRKALGEGGVLRVAAVLLRNKQKGRLASPLPYRMYIQLDGCRTR